MNTNKESDKRKALKSEVRRIIRKRYPSYSLWYLESGTFLRRAAYTLEEYAEKALEKRDMKTANTLYEEAKILKDYLKEVYKGYKAKRI